MGSKALSTQPTVVRGGPRVMSSSAPWLAPAPGAPQSSPQPTAARACALPPSAGVGNTFDAIWGPMDSWQKTISINLTAVVEVSCHVGSLLEGRGRRRVLPMSGGNPWRNDQPALPLTRLPTPPPAIRLLHRACAWPRAAWWPAAPMPRRRRPPATAPAAAPAATAPPAARAESSWWCHRLRGFTLCPLGGWLALLPVHGVH